MRIYIYEAAVLEISIVDGINYMSSKFNVENSML